MMKMLTGAALVAITLTPVTASAHELNSANGTLHPHQHVYQRDSYGKPLRQGHFAQPVGSPGIVIYGSSRNSNYGQSPGLSNPGISQPDQLPIQRIQKKPAHTSALRRQTYGKPKR